MSDKHKAAQKAARTRAENKAAMNYYREVTRPGKDLIQALLSSFIEACEDVRLRWNPKWQASGRKLKHGATEGTLVGVRDGFYLVVLADGYKRPQRWHPAFWDFIE